MFADRLFAHRRVTRRQGRTLAFVAGTAIVATASVMGGARSGQASLTLGVPAYGYPHRDSMWDGLAELRRGSIVIVNPDSGPGERVDPAYERALEPLRRRGVVLYGYVDTAYGKRSADDVVADARRFVDMYSPAGIFLDQTPPDAASVSYLRQISDALRADGLQVAFNPGQPDIDRRMVPLADHIINFEGDLATYRSTTFPAWAADAPPDRWWHLVYDVEADAMPSVVQAARDHGAGVVLITDGHMPNPWDHLPPYWDEEQAVTRP